MIDPNTNSIALTIKDEDLQLLRDTNAWPNMHPTLLWHTPQVKPLSGWGQDKLSHAVSMAFAHQRLPTGTIFERIPNNLVNGHPVFINGNNYCMFFSERRFWYIKLMRREELEVMEEASLTGVDLSDQIEEVLGEMTSCHSVDANIVGGPNNFMIMWNKEWTPISVNVEINPTNPKPEAKEAGVALALVLAGVGQPDELALMDVAALRQRAAAMGIAGDDIRSAGEVAGEYADMKVPELQAELEKRNISSKGKKAELIERLATAVEEDERMALMSLVMQGMAVPEPEPEPPRFGSGGGARFPKSKRGKKSKRYKKSKRSKRSKRSKKKSKKRRRRR